MAKPEVEKSGRERGTTKKEGTWSSFHREGSKRGKGKRTQPPKERLKLWLEAASPRKKRWG